MANVKRPSKSIIVNKALDFVFDAQVSRPSNRFFFSWGARKGRFGYCRTTHPSSRDDLP